ncbi:MAG: HAMP domain-containing histidine kinase [Cyanobacteria bacterium REEB65]|nr:HAMP domain-containing histidine kinase [Cyanobacteria bacterium REEB65]
MLKRLRTTLVTWYASTLVACVLLFGTSAIVVLHLALMREIDGTLLSTAYLIQTSVDEISATSPSAQRRQAIADETREIARGYGVAAVRITGSDGILVNEGRLSLERHAPGFADAMLDGKSYRIYTHTLAGSKASVEVAMSTHFDRELTHKGWLALAILSPLLLGMSIGGGLWLAARSSAPVDAAFERLKQFTADVSHELRTPLAIVQAEVDVALAKPQPEAQDLLLRIARIGKTNERMVQLVSELFLWVRQDSGGLTVQKKELPIADLLRDVTEGLGLIHPAIRFRVDAPEHLVVVGDPVFLRQALLNLGENAAHHSPPGQEVTLSARAGGGRATLEVADHGPGIAPEMLSHLFDRFSRAGDGPGLGLGLAISRAIVKAHGSVLECATEPGIGTRFWFDIDLVSAAAPVHKNATGADLS